MLSTVGARHQIGETVGCCKKRHYVRFPVGFIRVFATTDLSRLPQLSLRGIGGRGVGGLNTYEKDLVRLI